MSHLLSQQQEWPEVFADYTCIAHYDGKELVLESVSEGFSRITGYTLDEFNAHGGAAVTIFPEDVPIALQSLEQFISGEPHRNEIRIITKDGNIRWLRYMGRPEKISAEGQGFRIHGAVQDITETIKASHRLQESEQRFRQLAENIKEAIWLSDPLRTQIFYCSPAYEDIWGRSCESLYKQPWSLWDSVKPEDRAQVVASLDKLQQGEATDLEHRIVRPDGSIRWVRERSFPIKASSGQVYRVAGIADDITQRKRADELLQNEIAQRQEAEKALRLAHDQLEITVQQRTMELTEANRQIKASLAEKEVLLREIHHRVKNNLQIIISLLQLQAKNAKDPSAAEIFRESQNRVLSMALIHERLYHSKILAKVDFAAYVNRLVKDLLRSYQADDGLITFHTDVQEVHLPVDTAVPCGLAINELVSNCLKHAFPDRRKGEIRIELSPQREGKAVLSVRDNGVGHPADVDVRKVKTFGLRLVAALVDQLKGSFEIESRAGTAFRITFPLRK